LFIPYCVEQATFVTWLGEHWFAGFEPVRASIEQVPQKKALQRALIIAKEPYSRALIIAGFEPVRAAIVQVPQKSPAKEP